MKLIGIEVHVLSLATDRACLLPYISFSM